MTADLEFRVYGLPAPQGSKRHVGGGVMVESSKRVKPWRTDVTLAAIEAADATGHTPLTGPVALHVTYYLPRPRSHYRTGRFAQLLKPTAPVHVASSPDLDKIVRATCDALTTAGVWRDDALVARLVTEKRYGDQPGAEIRLTSLAVTA